MFIPTFVLQITMEVYWMIYDFITSKMSDGKYVIICDPEDDCVAYLLIHGTPNGNIIDSGNVINPGQWLKLNYDLLVSNGIEKVFTMSCYGGTQKRYVYRGITIESLHDSITPSYVETGSGTELGQSNLENEFFLRLYKFHPYTPKFQIWISKILNTIKRWVRPNRKYIEVK